MANPKISILVPVYNVEKYLAECLDSLVGQTLKEIEILCINDGSTDGSFRILREYQQKDNRILVIDKKNSGYGDSMNRGIKEAHGKYIGIVEPDDFVDLDAFEKMYKVAEKERADIVKANFYRYMTSKGKDVEKRNLFLADEVGKVIDPRKNRHIFFQQPSIWSAIYRTRLLREMGVDFLPSEGASYQDAGFNFKVFAVARRVVFIDAAFLHYRQDNPESSVKSAKKMYAVKNEYDAVEKFLARVGLMGEFGETLAIVRMGGYIWNMRRLRGEAAWEFAKIVRNDYGRYKKIGYLKPEKEDDGDASFIKKNIIIRDPEWYIRNRWRYEMNDNMRRFIWRCRRKML